MNCTNRDQDILLLEHGALSGMRRWATERHLRVCPRCQERREQQARLSRLVGAAVREAGPDLRSLYGVGAVAATAAVTATTVASAGAKRVRPARSTPLLRPAFVFGWAAVAATVAAAAWAVQETILVPKAEERGIKPPTIARPLPNSKAAHRIKLQSPHPVATPTIPQPPSEDAVIIEHSRD